jgi:hypothetical protein
MCVCVFGRYFALFGTKVVECLRKHQQTFLVESARSQIQFTQRLSQIDRCRQATDETRSCRATAASSLHQQQPSLSNDDDNNNNNTIPRIYHARFHIAYRCAPVTTSMNISTTIITKQPQPNNNQTTTTNMRIIDSGRCRAATTRRELDRHALLEHDRLRLLQRQNALLCLLSVVVVCSVEITEAMTVVFRITLSLASAATSSSSASK